MENDDSRLWTLWSKKLSGEATAEEIQELDALLKNPISQSTDIELIKKLWDRALENVDKPDIDKNWESISQSIFPEKSNLFVTLVPADTDKPTITRKKKWWLAAASLFFVICISIGMLYNNSNKKIAVSQSSAALPNAVVSRNGSKTSVTLPEGTKVWLNAGSKIYYDNDFTDNRQVYLTGEAYFDVTHNADKPFVIHAANVNIKVLGTAFNVKAYTEDDRVETALIRGSVEISTNDDPERKILLRPNEKISILKSKRNIDSLLQNNKATKNVAKEEFYVIDRMTIDTKYSSMEDIAWMKDKIIFKSESFSQLAKRIERWYAVTIVFKGESCQGIKFTGELDNLNIVQAMDALGFSCNYKFHYSIEKDQITIKSK